MRKLWRDAGEGVEESPKILMGEKVAHVEEIYLKVIFLPDPLRVNSRLIATCLITIRDDAHPVGSDAVAGHDVPLRIFRDGNDGQSLPEDHWNKITEVVLLPRILIWKMEREDVVNDNDLRDDGKQHPLGQRGQQ